MRDVNLIPNQRIQQKRCKTRVRLWASICAIYLASMALGLSSVYAMLIPDDDTATRLNQTIGRVKKYSHSIVELKKSLAQTRSALKTTWAIHGQPDWHQLLQIISANLGNDVVLTQCKLVLLNPQEDKPAAKGDHPTSLSAETLLGERHYTLALSGLARGPNAVSQFVLRLEGLHLFDTIRLEKSRRQPFQGQPAVSFALECRF